MLKMKSTGKTDDQPNGETLWWHRPLRVIQYNLQVKDTARMVPEQIAAQTEAMAANVVVVNMGGIYAWYPSRVRYHHVNEYLPRDRDLLKDLIDACHARGIRVVARFDFSLAEDTVYLEKPQWFVRDRDNNPEIRGKERMGDWSLLMATCINSGYRNEGVALPVLREAIEHYAIDGIFLNAPHARACHCDRCRVKYRDRFGSELPDRVEDFAPDWLSGCFHDNIGAMHRLIKQLKPELPLVLYYIPFGTIQSSDGFHKDNLDETTKVADMILTEAQNILSRGKNDIPQAWRPAVSMKFGNMTEHYPRPFGCIHTCPGMDWRHTGIPPAEHRFWMSQVPANNAMIWHSLTGFPDTISDKRILDSVAWVNAAIRQSEDQMEGASSLAQTLLIWDSSQSAMGWAEGLIQTQQQFDLMNDEQISLEKMKHYPVAILAAGFQPDPAARQILSDYVRLGGHLIVENIDPARAADLEEILGIGGLLTQSQYLSASYLNIEPDGQVLKHGFEQIALLPLRGRVMYGEPGPEARVMMTLVPPFAPLDAVGAPPERASLPVSHTDIPLVLEHDYGCGKVMLLAFELGMLAAEYRFAEFYRLMQNCVDHFLGENKLFDIDGVGGLQATVYGRDNRVLIHLVNGVGQRPLMDEIPLHNLKFRLLLGPGKTAAAVHAVISGQPVPFEVRDGVVQVELPVLHIWEMIEIQTENFDPEVQS